MKKPNRPDRTDELKVLGEMYNAAQNTPKAQTEEPENPEPPLKKSNRKVQIGVWIPEEIHQELLKLSFNSGLKISSLCRALIIKAFETYKTSNKLF